MRPIMTEHPDLAAFLSHGNRRPAQIDGGIHIRVQVETNLERDTGKLHRIHFPIKDTLFSGLYREQHVLPREAATVVGQFQAAGMGQAKARDIAIMRALKLGAVPDGTDFDGHIGGAFDQSLGARVPVGLCQTRAGIAAKRQAGMRRCRTPRPPPISAK